jgi:DNA modification methylase
MKTYLRLSNMKRAELPAEFRDDDVRFPEQLVEYFVQYFTQVGDVIFDPFAGFGTTLVVAEALGRIPFGIEFDQQRAHYIQARLQQPTHLIHGDSRHLASYAVPAFDFSLTSPPYMQKDDPEDPFTAYTLPGRGYGGYLETIQQIYAQMQQIMKPAARVVIEVANLKGAGGVTTLAWDIAAAVGQVLTFEGEIVIAWEEGYGYGYDHSYCLLFRKPSESGWAG